MDEDRKKVEFSFSAKGPRQCPYCKKEVEKDAVSCPYCHGTFVSSNRTRNAIGMIVLFAVLYWLLSSFVDCEANRKMEKIKRQVDIDMRAR